MGMLRFAGFVLVAAVPLLGQTPSASVVGRVTDASGAVAPGVAVKVSNLETNQTYRAASNGGPPRKYYQLSRQGQRALASGVSEWQTTRDAVDAVLGAAQSEVSV